MFLRHVGTYLPAYKWYTFQKTGIFTKPLWEAQTPQNAVTTVGTTKNILWDVMMCRHLACD
jgi:hypothetical protein